jgi:peptidoglycan/LPS O-acetylase OafA/YrhL
MSERFYVLDGMRGVAALIVVAFHISSIYPYVSYGYLAVDFFFALSGFVLSHAYAEKLRAGMSPLEFMARRVGRLYPLAVIGMAIGAAVYLRLHGWRNLAMALPLNGLLLPYPGPFIFPLDEALWSIFFELVASAAFIWLIDLRATKLLGLSVISALSLAAAYSRFPDEIYGLGYSWATFWAGFPRVFLTFTLGMAAHKIFERYKDPPLATPIAVSFAALGWLSYPIYCVHSPIIAVSKGLRIGEFPAITLVFAAAISAGLLVDKTQAQKRLTRLLARTLHRPSGAHWRVGEEGAEKIDG